jgi:hypothetical protein
MGTKHKMFRVGGRPASKPERAGAVFFYEGVNSFEHIRTTVHTLVNGAQAWQQWCAIDE